MKQDQTLESTCSVCLGTAMVSPFWQALRGKAKPLPSPSIFSNKGVLELLRTHTWDLAELWEPRVEQRAAQQPQQPIHAS